MHVVYVTTELCALGRASAGGLGSFVANMARIMRAKGNSVEIIYISTKEETIPFDEDIVFHNVYIDKSEWDEYNYLANEICDNKDKSDELRKIWVDVRKAQLVKDRLDELDSKEKIDIVHFSNLGGYSLFMDNTIPYVVRLSGFPNICEYGAELITPTLEFDANPIRKKDLLEMRALERAPVVISPSELCAGIAKKYLNKDVIVLESPFASCKESDDSVYNAHLIDKDYVLFFGSLNRNKGIHIISNIAEEYLKKHENSVLVLAGKDRIIKSEEGDISGIKYVYKKAGDYSDRVIYLGELSREQLSPIIKNSKGVMLPSRIDNLPNTCIEAMSLGAVVVGTDGASFEQMIVDGENGFLCERDNKESLLCALEKILSLSDETRLEISNNAQKTIDRMSPECVYENYLEVYSKVNKDWNLIVNGEEQS